MEFKIKLLNGETKTVKMGSDYLYRITTFSGDEWEERRRFYTGVYITELTTFVIRTTYGKRYEPGQHRSEYNSILLDEIENIEEIVI